MKTNETPGRNSDRDFTAIARQYCSDVLSGAIPACKWVRLACQRQVDDLARSASDGWQWTFDEDKAARVCKFIELLPHVKGKWSSPLIRLEPWQVFILTTVFGWVDADGNRRFRRVYIEVPRKNSKSTITSGVALYMLAADGENGADVYSAATKREQAKIVWDDAKRMVDRTEGLRRRFGVATLAHSITVESAASKFVALASEADSLDGLNLHFGGVDELHAHKTRAVWDVLDSAMGSRRQPMLWAITTAGFNRAGICYEQRTYVIRILERSHVDERYFGIIWTIDLAEKLEDGTETRGDDWTDPAIWQKANPNYGVSVLPEDLAAMCRKAQQSAQSQNNFLTKRLNVWVNAETAYFNMDVWRRRCLRAVSLDEFERADCWIGLDLSSKSDCTAKARVFRRDEEDGEHWYVFANHYLPEDVVEERVNANCSHYAGWAREDRMILTDGAQIDLDFIEQEVREDLSKFNVKAVAYDEWNCAQLAGHLETDGAPMVKCPMNWTRLSEPMKMFAAFVNSGRIHHDGDPVLTWMLSNVVGKHDHNDNVFPRKERFENKIDAAVAVIMALGMAIRESGNNVYEYTGLRSVGA